MNAVSTPRNRQQGQSTVEFALLMPFLVLLLAGVIDLGRAYDAQISLTSAASQGALYGSLNPGDSSGIRTRVTNALAGTGVTIAVPAACPDICITYPSGNSAGQPIRVQVEYRLTTIVGSILGSSTITIRGANQSIIN
jgi:Flp pilus assembly protein TadG